MRISDWSSDVCSSDLPVAPDHVAEFLSRARGRAECGSDVGRRLAVDEAGDRRRRGADGGRQSGTAAAMADQLLDARPGGDRKSVVSGKSVSVRVELGGRRLI